MVFKFNDYNPFKLRRSAGLGMRFFLPMFGLLGFDYGIGLIVTTRAPDSKVQHLNSPSCWARKQNNSFSNKYYTMKKLIIAVAVHCNAVINR
jgi:hypothetical protein